MGQQRAVAVVDGEVFHGGIPHGRIRHRLHRDTEDPSRVGEHAFQHFLHREVRPDHLFFHVVEAQPHFFGVVAEIPSLQRRSGLAFQAAPERLQFSRLLLKGRPRLIVQIVEEFQNIRAALRHSRLGLQIGECGIAEQGRLLAPQFEGLFHHGAVVVRRRGGNVHSGTVELFADRSVIQIAHHRQEARRLQRETPAGLPLRFRARGRGAARRIR